MERGKVVCKNGGENLKEKGREKVKREWNGKVGKIRRVTKWNKKVEWDNRANK